MRNYLNGQEKNAAYMISTFCALIEKYVGEGKQEGTWQKGHAPKDRIRDARMAKTYLAKVLNSMIQPLSDEATVDLLKSSKHKRIMVIEKSDVPRQRRKIEEDWINGDVTITRGELYAMLVPVMEHICYPCRKDEVAAEICPLRMFFDKYNIPPLEEETSAVCDFQWLDEKE